MGEGGIEPPTTRRLQYLLIVNISPADLTRLNKSQLMYHTRLDHPPIQGK